MKVRHALWLGVVLLGSFSGMGARGGAQTPAAAPSPPGPPPTPTGTTCLLQYRYQAGEVVTYAIEHQATVDTTIAGNSQKTQMRSKSTRSLHVEDVQPDGRSRFVHIIDDVDMWSEVGGRAAVRYNSREDREPPAEYAHVAESVGVPISTITMSADGQIVERQDKVVHPNFGLGGISIPLPAEPVAVGHEWSQPLDLQIRLDDNRVKTIKTRQLYRLEKVETGVATISLKTQVLTPVDDARVKSQLVQRLSSGEIRFDLDAGRLLSKQLDWDETVLSFNGADSSMKYLARLTEQLINTDRTASAPVPEGPPTR